MLTPRRIIWLNAIGLTIDTDGEPTRPKPVLCMGYAQCCQCEACKARAAQAQRGFTETGGIRPPVAPAQPWDRRSAA